MFRASPLSMPSPSFALQHFLTLTPLVYEPLPSSARPQTKHPYCRALPASRIRPPAARSPRPGPAAELVKSRAAAEEGPDSPAPSTEKALLPRRRTCEPPCRWRGAAAAFTTAPGMPRRLQLPAARVNPLRRRVGPAAGPASRRPPDPAPSRPGRRDRAVLPAGPGDAARCCAVRPAARAPSGPARPRWRLCCAVPAALLLAARPLSEGRAGFGDCLHPPVSEQLMTDLPPLLLLCSELFSRR